MDANCAATKNAGKSSARSPGCKTFAASSCARTAFSASIAASFISLAYSSLSGIYETSSRISVKEIQP